MSPREQLAVEFTEWLSNTGRFTAPYGILQGLESNKRARGVTFGVSRVSDIHLSIYSPTYMILRDSRYGGGKYTSLDAVKADLKSWYSL